MHIFFPDWVNGAGWNQTAAVLFTDLPLRSVGEISAQRFEAIAGILQLGLGLPLYIALLLASRAKHVFWKILAGALILLPFLMWSIGFTWLRQVLTLRGAYSVMELGFSPWQVSLIALADQLAKLIFPVLAPVLIWLAFESRFAEDVFLQKRNHGLINQLMRIDAARFIPESVSKSGVSKDSPRAVLKSDRLLGEVMRHSML